MNKLVHTTCTVANSLNVTRLGNSGAGDCELFVLMTGLRGVWRGFASKPADVASSRSFCDKPLCGLFGVVITCGSWLGVMYLKKNKIKN